MSNRSRRRRPATLARNSRHAARPVCTALRIAERDISQTPSTNSAPPAKPSARSSQPYTLPATSSMIEVMYQVASRL